VCVCVNVCVCACVCVCVRVCVCVYVWFLPIAFMVRRVNIPSRCRTALVVMFHACYLLCHAHEQVHQAALCFQALPHPHLLLLWTGKLSAMPAATIRAAARARLLWTGKRGGEGRWNDCRLRSRRAGAPLMSEWQAGLGRIPAWLCVPPCDHVNHASGVGHPSALRSMRYGACAHRSWCTSPSSELHTPRSMLCQPPAIRCPCVHMEARRWPDCNCREDMGPLHQRRMGGSGGGEGGGEGEKPSLARELSWDCLEDELGEEDEKKDA